METNNDADVEAAALRVAVEWRKILYSKDDPLGAIYKTTPELRESLSRLSNVLRRVAHVIPPMT